MRLRFEFDGGDYIELGGEPPHGVIASNLKSDDAFDYEYNAAVDGMEALLLSMYAAGVPLDTPQVREAIADALDAIVNNTL